MNKRIFWIGLASIWSIYSCICLIFCILGRNSNWFNVFLPLISYIVILFIDVEFNKDKNSKFLAWLWISCLIVDFINCAVGNSSSWILVFCPLLCLVRKLWEFVIFSNEKRNV